MILPTLPATSCSFLVSASHCDSSVSPANKQAASPLEKWLLLLLGWPFLGHRGEQHLPAATTAVLLVGLKAIPFD